MVLRSALTRFLYLVYTALIQTPLTYGVGQNKPNGQFHLPFEQQSITEFVQDLSIRKIPGIGRVNERLLEAMGVKVNNPMFVQFTILILVQTCGDIFERRADLYLLSAMKVVSLSWLLSIHLGISSNVVCPSSRDERRSIGAERTFSTLSDHAKIMGKLEEVVEELSSDMKDGGWAGKTITLKYKLDTFEGGLTCLEYI
jgi:DNA polymerase kappa